MKPTQEQVEKFWRWCGFKPISDDAPFYENPNGDIYYDHVGRSTLPPLDLNNLFKWAVPKVYAMDNFWLIDYQLTALAKTMDITGHSWSILFNGEGRGCHGTDEDPALALFWAIYNVMEGQ